MYTYISYIMFISRCRQAVKVAIKIASFSSPVAMLVKAPLNI